jgi:competence protein ComEA
MAPSGTAATAKKVNINTATAGELDSLPDIGKARSKAILDERAKGKFKDWSDFERRMAGTSVNEGVMAKIKDRATF